MAQELSPNPYKCHLIYDIAVNPDGIKDLKLFSVERSLY